MGFQDLCCVASLYIPICGTCEDVLPLTIFQDSMYGAKLIRVGVSWSETVVGRCRCLNNVFTCGLLLSGKKYVRSIRAFTYGPSPKYLISKYSWGSSSNGRSPSVWWYFFKFFAIITFSSGILTVIHSVLPLLCSWVTKVVPGLLNYPLMYLIRVSRVK